MRKNSGKKAEQTQQFIIEKSAPIFNSKGYAGTALSDIMDATGLTKGCIYGNFKDKEEIALAAFDFNIDTVFGAIGSKIPSDVSSIKKLHIMLDEHLLLYKSPALANGCPLLNAAIDADDTNPRLRERVKKALDRWRLSLVRIVKEGIAKKEIIASIDADEFATNFIAIIEGGNMLFNLFKDANYAVRAITQVKRIINQELIP